MLGSALTRTLAWVLPSQPSGGLWMPKVGPERTDPVGKHPYQVLSSFCLLIISTEQPLQPGPCAHPSHQHFPKPGTGAPGELCVVQGTFVHTMPLLLALLLLDPLLQPPCLQHQSPAAWQEGERGSKPPHVPRCCLLLARLLCSTRSMHHILC